VGRHSDGGFSRTGPAAVIRHVNRMPRLARFGMASLGFAMLACSAVTVAAWIPSFSARQASAAAGTNVDPQQELLAGDTDCNGSVDAADALFILRFVALGEASDCLRTTGNVRCDDALDASDAVAILRYVVGENVRLPIGCPPIGQPILQPPEVSLSCDAADIQVSDHVTCQYSAESYVGDVSLSWNLGDGLEPVVNPAVLGAECAPDRVPCWYSAWGTKTVAFRYSGLKVIALTACANGDCATEVWRLTVASPSVVH
jgi:hypothetical protein